MCKDSFSPVKMNQNVLLTPSAYRPSSAVCRVVQANVLLLLTIRAVSTSGLLNLCVVHPEDFHSSVKTRVSVGCRKRALSVELHLPSETFALFYTALIVSFVLLISLCINREI